MQNMKHERGAALLHYLPPRDGYQPGSQPTSEEYMQSEVQQTSTPGNPLMPAQPKSTHIPHTFPHTDTQTCACMHTHAPPHSHTHTHTHTRTQTHTHFICLWQMGDCLQAGCVGHVWTHCSRTEEKPQGSRQTGTDGGLGGGEWGRASGKPVRAPDQSVLW